MSQLDNLEHLTQLQKTIDACEQLKLALMYANKEPERPIKDMIADVSSESFVLSKLLDERPPSL